MIGILGAMPVEIDGLMSHMQSPREHHVGRMTFTRGELYSRDVVLAMCGVGKVNAAACAQALIMTFHPELIINIGVGGSLHPDLKYGSVAVATHLVQHDVDTTALGDPYGWVSTVNRLVFPCDERVVELVCQAVADMGIDVMRGPIASGDQFIADQARKAFIVEHFGAICCEMEGGAIAHVCLLNDTPCAVIRSISDNADKGAHEDYPQFVARAAQCAEALIQRVLSK